MKCIVCATFMDKEIIQYLRIRETRCLQNALKWSEIKSFSGTNIKNLNPLVFFFWGGPQSAAPKPLPRLLLDPSYGPGLVNFIISISGSFYLRTTRKQKLFVYFLSYLFVIFHSFNFKIELKFLSLSHIAISVTKVKLINALACALVVFLKCPIRFV